MSGYTLTGLSITALLGISLLVMPGGVAEGREAPTRLPLLGPDREPVDLLRRRPPDVERILEERERDREVRRAERRRQVVEEEVEPHAQMDELLLDEELRAELETPPASAVIEVERVWAEETAGHDGVALVEMRLHNEGEESRRLSAVYTDAAEEAAVHATVTRGGVRQTRRLRNVHLPAGSAVDLRPGGPELLLIDLHHPLSRGEAVEIVLEFDDGSFKAVEVPIRRAPWRGG